MQELSLSTPPTGVSEDSWIAPASDIPQLGDLWLLSWDGLAPGLVVLSRVEARHVVGWPVTLNPEAAVWPAVRAHSDTLDRDVTVWPQAATGLGNHLLHRNLGHLMSSRAMDLTRTATRVGAEAPFPYESEAPDDHRKAIVSNLLNLYTSLCFHEWPPADEDVVIDREAFAAAGGSLTLVTKTLDLAVSDALQVLDGTRPVEDSQTAALAEVLGISPDRLTRRPSGPAVDELLRPTHKEALLRVMSRRQVGEAEARLLARSEYALAARTDRPGDEEARMNAALRRLAQPQ